MGFFGSKSTPSTGSGGGVGPAGRKTSGTYGTAKDAKQALKRNVFRNQGAKNIKATTKKVPSPVLSILSIPLQHGSRINRDFFTDKVLGSKNFKKTTKQDFEKMSLGDQEKMYDTYMSGRQSGQTDAYGNTISQGGGDNKNQGIELAKSATGTATVTGPGEIQKEAANTIKGPTTTEMSADQILLANKRKGRRVTNITAKKTLAKDYKLSEKTLLG